MRFEASKKRSLAAAALAGALVMSTGAITVAQDAEPDLSGQSLVISNWEGYMPEDLPQRFEDATGVPVTVANHATNEEIMGKLTAGGGLGLRRRVRLQPVRAGAGRVWASRQARPRQIPNLANLYPEADRAGTTTRATSISAPYAWGTTGLCYRSTS